MANSSEKNAAKPNILLILTDDIGWSDLGCYGREISTPMIVHWPQGMQVEADALTNQTGYITDFMPTLLEICGATYPQEQGGVPIIPHEGESLGPIFRGENWPPRLLCMEHEGNRMVRQGDWKLVALHEKSWELYDLAQDPVELHDLSAAQPERVQKMSNAWQTWANRCMVV